MGYERFYYNFKISWYLFLFFLDPDPDPYQMIRIQIQEKGLKCQCHEIFDLYIFSLIEPNWSPDKQAKMVLLTNSFSRRYLNLKFKKFDSAKANTAGS